MLVVMICLALCTSYSSTVVTTKPIIPSSNKIHNGDILVPAYSSQFSWKMTVKRKSSPASGYMSELSPDLHVLSMHAHTVSRTAINFCMITHHHRVGLIFVNPPPPPSPIRGSDSGECTQHSHCVLYRLQQPNLAR